jgi:hypothetical protein
VYLCHAVVARDPFNTRYSHKIGEEMELAHPVLQPPAEGINKCSQTLIKRFNYVVGSLYTSSLLVSVHYVKVESNIFL